MKKTMYNNPAIYEMLFRPNTKEDKDFYISKALEVGGKTLYVGPGEGRIFIPMLSRGVDVIGIDNSSEMIKCLNQKIKKDYGDKYKQCVFEMDLCDFSFDIGFDLIILPNRVFCHILSREEQKKTIINIFNHLVKGGKLILNYYSPSSDGGIFSVEDKKMLYKEVTLDDKTYIVWTVNKKDKFSQTYKRYFFIDVFNNANKEVENYFFIENLRYTYVSEFENLLELAGFSKFKKYGDFRGGDYDKSSKEVIWEIEK